MQELLRAATPLLLEPFRGVPEVGSVYGDASTPLPERAAAYQAAMSERIGKARGAGAKAQAAALEALRDHVMVILDTEVDGMREEEGRGDGPTAADEVAVRLAAAIASDDMDDKMMRSLK